jgi:chromatin segregation and condensation protein Rec8/ScpA/Scc1 (kleisin family)
MSEEEKREWDRQPGESSRAYAQFCLYRDMGQERSLRKLAAGGKPAANLRQLEHWSSRWKWVHRCQKYDDYLAYQDRLRHEKEREQMNDRHAKIAVLGQNIIVREMESLLAKAQSGGAQMTPADVARLMDVTVRVERLARGEPSESHEVTGPGHGPVLDIKQSLAKIRQFYGLAPEKPTTKRADDNAAGPAGPKI